MAKHGAVQILTHYPGLVLPPRLAGANSVHLSGIEEPAATSSLTTTTATTTILAALLPVLPITLHGHSWNGSARLIIIEK